MKTIFRHLFAAAAVIGCCSIASAEIPLDWYAPLDGLKGAELKTAVHELMTTNVKMLSYGGTGSTASSIKIGTWWGFYVTDRLEDNSVRDRYSARTFYFGDRSYAVSGMNIEHSFPKSWWGGAENNAYKDLFNLMPCESSINSSKSNFPMGNVDNVSTSNDVTKIGWRSGESGSQNKYWEPADNWKGDFARGYMYMATAYQDFSWTGAQATRILQDGAYPTLQPWAYNLYLQWADGDPVDEIETVRNNSVEQMQGNRNPFVDFVNLDEYIWGDSVDVAFHPLTSVKSQSFYGGRMIGRDAADYAVIFENSFLGDKAGCTTTAAPGSSSAVTVWYNNESYGWKASGSKGSSANLTRYDTDVTLWLPEQDLTGYAAAVMDFEHAAKFVDGPSSALSVVAQAVGSDNTEVLTVRQWPLGVNWDFVSGGPVDLSAFCGKKVKVGFRYTSTTSEAGTWELKNVKISGYKGDPSGIESVGADIDDAAGNLPEEYYTIDGRRLPSRDAAHGFVIIRRGHTATKVFIP